MNTEPSDRIEPNALSETVDRFDRLYTLMKAVIEAPESPFDFSAKTPFRTWFEALEDVTYGDGLTETTAPLVTQHEQSHPFTLEEYRERYGDRTWVTDFRCIDLEPLSDAEYDPAVAISAVCESESITLPCSPISGRRLPLWVTTQSDLQNAFEILIEFPPEPSRSAGESPPAEGNLQETDRDTQDTSTTEVLAEIEREFDVSVSDKF